MAQRIVRIVMALASSITAFAICELFLRAVETPDSLIRLDQFIKIVEIGHRVPFTDVFESHPDRFWRLKPDVRLSDDNWPFVGLVSNSVGLREDHEISLIRAEREVRVLFVGGSVTFGFMALPEDTIPHFLEQALQDRLPDRKVESINAGTPGYSLFQGWRFLLAEGFDYSPDVIVLQFGLNEGETWDDLGDRLHHQAWVEAQPFEPLRWSRVFHLLWKLRSIDSADRDPDLEPEPKPRPRILPDEYVELLREINKETERRGIELLLFVAPNALNLNMEFPWRRTKYQQATLDYGPMVMFGPEYRPGLVDGIPVAQKLRRDHPLHDLLFEDGVHVRPMLAKALAEQLADKIAPVFESE